MPKKRLDVLIVGAGLTGLKAAQVFNEIGLEILILEAQDRVGGRTLSIPSSDGSYFIDHGGQYISPGQDQLLGLINQFNLKTFPVYEGGNQIDFRAGQKKIYSGIFAPDEKRDEEIFLKAARQLYRMASNVPLEAPWKTPNAKELDDQSFKHWLDLNVASALASEKIVRMVEGVYATGPGHTSLLAALFCIKSGDGLDPFNCPTTETELRIEGGAQALCQVMADSMSEHLRLKSKVQEIRQDRNAVYIKTEENIYEAKFVLVALPPTMALRISYFPSLPAQKDHLFQRIPMGWVIKTHFVYSQAFWRNQGLSGTVSSDSGPIRVCTDNSPPCGSPGILLAFVEGEAAIHLASMALEERKGILLKQLEQFFGNQASQAIAYFEKSWGDDEFSRGCYGGYFSQNLWTSYGPWIAKPWGRIHWAGAEFSSIWNGKMEGALISGKQLAEDMIEGLTR